MRGLGPNPAAQEINYLHRTSTKTSKRVDKRHTKWASVGEMLSQTIKPRGTQLLPKLLQRKRQGAVIYEYHKKGNTSQYQERKSKKVNRAQV
jgi:hypothetical protein